MYFVNSSKDIWSTFNESVSILKKKLSHLDISQPYH